MPIDWFKQPRLRYGPWGTMCRYMYPADVELFSSRDSDPLSLALSKTREVVSFYSPLANGDDASRVERYGDI